MTGADVRMHPHLLYTKPAKRRLFRGQWMTVPEISELTGIPKPVIYRRMKEGRAPDEGKPRRCHRYEFRGQLMTVPQIAQLTGLTKWEVYGRRCGERVMDEDEFEAQRGLYREPHPTTTLVTYRGQTLSLRAWAQELGMNHTTLYNRWLSGWEMARIATTPVDTTRNGMTHNRRVIRSVIRRFRKARNQQLIQRITQAFHSATGGYIQTSHSSQGTGVGRHLRDLHQEKSL